MLPAWRCSASLLSATVALTAGHCTDGAVAARVWFAEDVQSNSKYPFGRATSYEGVPYTYPDFCIGCGNGLPGFAYHDVGIIVLTEPEPTSVVGEYAQLPSPGLVDECPARRRSPWSATECRSGSSAAARRCGPGSGSGQWLRPGWSRARSPTARSYSQRTDIPEVLAWIEPFLD